VLVQAADAAFRVEHEHAAERFDRGVQAIAYQCRLGELDACERRAAVGPVPHRDRFVQGDCLGGSAFGPSLRAESFHNALYESMGLADRAATAARMLQRLAAAISAELTAIESAERRADDNRRLRYAVAIGFVSAVAVPVGLIFAFLSTSTSQVNRAWSMFSHHYLAMYLAVIAIMVIGGLLGVGLYIQQRRDARQHRSPTERPQWIPVTDEPPAMRQL
jgi:hypothetical protein